jgi:hypothetical protein
MPKSPIFIAALVLNYLCVLGPSSAAEYTTRPIILDIDNPDRENVGALEWRGGVEILSEDKNFGGLSGLYIGPDGQHLSAVSDHGHWFNASLRYRDGILVGIDKHSLSRMIGKNGKALKKSKRDAESLATLDGKTMLVSFERRHRIARYSTKKTAPVLLAKPLGYADLANNGGVEAITYLCDGRLLAIAEKNKTRDPHVQGWIMSGDEQASFTYKTTAGFRPTGAATLPNCDIIIVERSFSFIDGIAVRVTLVKPTNFHAGATVNATEIARFDGSVSVDNFEGISARKSKTGETLIYLISDDNYNPLQRTLLMMFALKSQ